jgi:hypothetical protein
MKHVYCAEVVCMLNVLTQKGDSVKQTEKQFYLVDLLNPPNIKNFDAKFMTSLSDTKKKYAAITCNYIPDGLK